MPRAGGRDGACGGGGTPPAALREVRGRKVPACARCVMMRREGMLMLRENAGASYVAAACVRRG